MLNENHVYEILAYNLWVFNFIHKIYINKILRLKTFPH